MVTHKTETKLPSRYGVWSEWWLIAAALFVGLAMIGVGVLVFQGEQWLIGLGVLVTGGALYGVMQEILGAIIDLFANRSKMFLSFVLLILANGYWLLIAA